MVLQKRLDYGISGYQVPPIPQVPKYAKGKRSVRKKTVENQMCAFDLLAAVAGKLLLEGESSSGPSPIVGTSNRNDNNGKDAIKKQQLTDEKPVKSKAYDSGSCHKTALGTNSVGSRGATPKLCSPAVKSAPSPADVSSKTDTQKEACIEKHSPFSGKLCEWKTKHGGLVDQNASTPCSLVNKMDVDAKPHALGSSVSSLTAHATGYHVSHTDFSPKCRDEKLSVNRDDDENSSGCTHPSIRTNNKALMPQGLGNRRMRKQLTTRFWKVAKTMAKDRELSNAGMCYYKSYVEMKPPYHHKKICYTRQRTQRSSFKRRRFFQHCSMSTPDSDENRVSSSSVDGHNVTSFGSEDFHVKLSIKSFKVPELFIEIPETSTVGSLKRTVMEAVTAILGGGLRVGVLLQGRKVRDDNKTLVQAGISHGDKLDDLGFTLEANSSQSPPLLTGPEEPHLVLPSNCPEPLIRHPDVVSPLNDVMTNVAAECPSTPQANYLESDHDSVLSATDTLSIDKIADDACPLIATPSTRVEALPMTPVRKTRRPDIAQRRIRRPFSVSEVEALVQAVEKLGTGRWRDVKIRAFDNAKHRTYVDLKDKWKTLVHTAKISPQQRRGEPVPQELLDRVLSAHAYWSQQQAKLQSKSPSAESCLLI